MKKAKTARMSSKVKDGRNPFSALLPAAPPQPVLEHSDWPSDAQWLAFWARQEQLMLQHGMLGPEASEALAD